MESGTGTGSSKNATADLQEDIATLKQRVNGLEVANGALENKYAVSSTALNTSVVFLQSTMDHLMAKNDSVSYDVHIAAMDAMLDKLTVTNAKALANAADTSSLVAMQSKTTGELNASIAALVGDVVQLGTQINSNLMQVQAALNLTDGRVTDSYLQLQRQTAGAAAHEAKVAAINTTVVFLQSTVDHLMAKNDSVSYDMHIAAMEAMLEKYTETEASVLANSGATAMLGAQLGADFETLNASTADSLAALNTRANDANKAIAVNADGVAALKEAAGTNADSIAALEEEAINALKLAQENNASIVEVDGTVGLVEEKQEVLGSSVNAQENKVGALNKTVADLQAAIKNFADPDADPTIKQQVALISDAMKEYGLYTQCNVGSWSSFGACSHDCDGGTMERARSIKPLAGYEDVKGACPVGKETISCNTGACPKDCKVGNYTAWTNCSSQCGSVNMQKKTHILPTSVLLTVGSPLPPPFHVC